MSDLGVVRGMGERPAQASRGIPVTTDPWRSAYVPQRLEVVTARSFEDGPALVLAVDRRRQKALLHLEQPAGSVRRWDWFSMIAPRSLPPANEVGGFLRACKRDPAGFTPTSILYRAYVAWCARSGAGPVAIKSFTLALADAGLPAGMRWVGSDGRRRKVRVRLGIVL